MKNATIALSWLLAGCSDYEMRSVVQPVAPPIEDAPPGDPEIAVPAEAPVEDVVCGVVELVVVAATPSPTFQSDGVVELTLVPLDAAGELVLDCDWSVSAAGAGVMSVLTVPAADQPTVFALDLDSSGSMASADPAMLRIPAAQEFVLITEAARADNQHGVFTFPRDPVGTFSVSEMLADFTDDATVAAEAVAQVGSPGGSTPLYESAIEIMEYQALATVGADVHKALVLFSDGEPSDQVVTLTDVLAVADATGTTLHTVGLGLSDPDAVGVLQNLAFSTGGTYSGALEAADLDLTFANLAASLAGGHLVVTIVFSAPPPTGTDVSGEVTVEDVTGGWSFLAP